MVSTSWRKVILLYLAAVSGFLLVDAAVFRTNLYTSILEPDSTAGSVEVLLNQEAHRHRTGLPEVIAMGDSRIAEGMSAPLANEVSLARGYEFINGSVPGATPRCWYYFLRQIDPHANRYSVVILPLDDYTDEDGFGDVADSMVNMHMVALCLRITDLYSFPASFHNARDRFEAARGTLFKGFLYKEDFEAFVEHPEDRLKKVAQFREHEVEWKNEYGGNPGSMTGLTVDWNKRTVTFPPSVPPAQQEAMRGLLLRPVAPQTGKYAAYRRLWFGKIIQRYQGTRTRILFLRIPRGPVVRPESWDPSHSSVVRELAKNPGVILMDPETFDQLERPEYFFDLLHMNATGRKIFSALLANKVIDALNQGKTNAF